MGWPRKRGEGCLFGLTKIADQNAILTVITEINHCHHKNIEHIHTESSIRSLESKMNACLV